MRHEPTLHQIAAANRGLVPAVAARGAGVSPSALARRVGTGELELVQPGVWRIAGCPPHADQARLAVALAAGRGAALSHRTAALIHGLIPEAGTDLIDLTVPRDRRPRLRGVMLHRSLDLVPDHVRTVDGLPVTTIDRTLADLGDVVPRHRVAWAMERAIIDRRTTTDRLWRMLDAIGGRGRNGRGALREALEEWLFSDRPPDSVLEVMFARLVRNHRLPVPLYQHLIRLPDGTTARVDACWPRHRVIAEADGHHFHSTAGQFRSDLRRQNALVALGYTVLRYPWHAVVRTPGAVAAELRPFLGPIQSRGGKIRPENGLGQGEGRLGA